MKQPIVFLENIRNGVHTLHSHKLRSFLTVLGVVTGVVTVVVVASILTGLRSSIVDLVEQFGTDNIYAFHLSTGPRTGPRDRNEWQRKPLTQEDVQALREHNEFLVDVAYQGFARMDRALQYGREIYRRGEILGVSPNLDQVTSLVLQSGRFINEIDDLRRNEVCVLGSSVAEALFPYYQEVVGREILLGGRPFTVIGVLEKRKSTVMGSADQVVYIPYRTMRRLAPRSDFLLVLMKAEKGQLDRAMGEAEAVLRRQRGVLHQDPNDFDLTTAERLIEQFDAITATVGLVAIAISGVGLLVGGIGVMNIMLVSVTERTREIGLRKAVGARRGDIALQFLFEAVTLTTAGGLLGILAATGVSFILIWALPALPSSIPIWAVITGFAVSMAVGLIFGVWPAIKASQLDPIESLRYE